MVWTLLLFICSLSLSNAGTRKISDVYLLLPQTLHAPNARHVHYKIQAYEGCYRWSTANPKVVALTEIPGGILPMNSEGSDTNLMRDSYGKNCYPESVLEPVATVDRPPVTLVTAADQLNNGQILKCEVKVEKIVRLEILTTVKSFRVQDHQRLLAQAYDAEGNVFSSLEGLRFRWQIVSGSDAMGIPRLKDSLVTSSEVRREIENSNYQSDIILVEGKSTGIANITLKIEEPGYEDIPVAWTIISISEPFTIIPSTEIIVPVRSFVKYRIFKVFEGKLYKEIDLPSKEFKWSTPFAKLLEVKDSGELFTLDEKGIGHIVVHDTKIESNTLQCEVNVVAPDRMVIIVEPYKAESPPKRSYNAEEFLELSNPKESPKSNWNLISGQTYSLKIKLFWRNKEILIPENANFKVTFQQPEFWDVTSKSQNGDHLVVIPKLAPDYVNNILPTKIYGKLEVVKSRNSKLQDWIPDPAITDTEDVTILKPVKIIEERRPVLLPYFAVLTQAPDRKGHLAQEYKLKVQGGSPSLQWETSDSSVASVTPNGIVYAHRLGNTIISVIDASNNNNRDSISIEVAMVEKLIFKDDRKEIIKDHSEVSEIVGLASQSRKFHNCSSIYLDWEVRKGQDIVKVLEKGTVTENKRFDGVCEVRGLGGASEGQALLSVKLIHQATEISSKQPEIRLSSEEGRIGVFLPLSLGIQEKVEVSGNNITRTFIYEKNAIVLTPGSSAAIPLVGGPLPWDDFPQYFHEQATDEQRYLNIQIQSKKLPRDRRTLYVACPAGVKNKDFSVQISVYNEKFEELRAPGLSTLSLAIGCYLPNAMTLNWLNDKDYLSDLKWKALPTYYDRFNRKLPSAFSEGYWVILHNQELKVNLTLWDNKSRLFYNFSSSNLEWSSDKPELISYLNYENPIHQKATLIGIDEGPVTLEARINKLQDGTVLYPSVSANLHNEVVKNVEISPNSYSLYLHKQNVLELYINYGSGLFEISSNSSDIIQYAYDGYRKISVFPKRSGRVSIRVDDKGLPGSLPAFSNILVSGLAAMELKEGGLIQVNSTIVLQLTALDSEGRPFNLNEHKWMNLELQFGSSDAFKVISVSDNFYEWVLKGVVVGDFQVYAYGNKMKIGDDTSTQRSNIVLIDVFPPLEIIPPDVLLLPGSKYTLNYRGGPDPSKYTFYQIYLNWIMTDDKVAIIDSTTGLLTTLKVGETPINLQMLRKREVLTQAFGRIRVKLATSVGILGMGPGRSVLKDSATRLVAVIYHNGETFTDGNTNIDYTWKSNSPTVYSIFQEGDDIGKQIAVTGLALAGGKSDITLHVEIHYPAEYKGNEHLFNSKVTASVDQSLISQTPSHRCISYLSYDCQEEFSRWMDSTIFLMPIYSQFKLPSNKEDKATFRCLECREELIKVSDQGVVTAGSQKGEASIIIHHARVKGDFHPVNIAVTDIESILIDKAYLSRSMALGSELEFSVICQDLMARSFPAGFEYGVDIGLEVSNSRVVQASLENRNSTLKIRSQYVGDTLVKVFLNSNPLVKDIILVSVSSVMRPVAPVLLHLGGEVQFQTTHSTPAGVEGSWSVENPNIVSVDSRGYVKSLQEGETYIHYKEKSMDLKSLVVVSKIKAINLAPGAPSHITNYEKHPHYQENYKIPLKLYLDSEKTKELAPTRDEDKKLIKQNISMRCITPSHSEWVTVSSAEDKTSRSEEPNSYSCIITPIQNPASISIPPKEIAIKVIFSAKDKSLYTQEATVYLPFISKFVIPTSDKQVILSGRVTKHVVQIGGNCQTIQANSDLSLITVQKSEVSGKCQLEIGIMGADTDMRQRKVEVIDSVTGQKEDIYVTYYVEAGKIDTSAPFSLHDLLVIVALAFLVYILYYFFKSSPPGHTPVRIPQAQSGMHQPRAPQAHLFPQPMRQTPNISAGPASSPGSSAYKQTAYRPNY
ncbi:NUP210 [Blepharisma stoltei]|uniref:Nuclear pore membrane glycoprotein 210 n=1 Tax=Blepharisma stoltei TaxID=1481888 RepID=A0AAU9IFV1_9CILI|nr:unnamed protein product [Blepharisma stoltei]